jgi:Spy/CpxP family protein refolding chaperone
MLKGLSLLIAIPVMVCAQMPHGMWWEGKVAQDINLTDAQVKQINGVRKEFRSRMFDQRAAMMKAEGEVEAAFNDDPVDQRKANEAIDRLATARAELFRVTSQMELRFRSVLTADQWQELKKRQPPRQGPGGFGPGSPNQRRRMPDRGTTQTTGAPIQQR